MGSRRDKAEIRSVELAAGGVPSCRTLPHCHIGVSSLHHCRTLPHCHIGVSSSPDMVDTDGDSLSPVSPPGTHPGTPPVSPPGTPAGTLKSELLRLAACLIEIDEIPIYKRALEDSTNEATIKAKRIKELTSRSDKLKTVIFQVVGFYLVFQGVMITVVAQSTFLKKGNLWSPMLLSSAAAVSCFIPVWQKGWAIAHIQGDMHDEEKAFEVASLARSELRRLGINYPFFKSSGKDQQSKETRQSKKRSEYFYFVPYTLILGFIVCFTVLILISQWRIRHG